MSYSSLITKIVLSFILSSTILYRYGNWFRHRIFVTLIVLLAWYFSFLVIFALPLDIINTVYRQCNSTVLPPPPSSHNTQISLLRTECEEPLSLVPDQVFPNLWRTVYWSMQFLTWLVMPMMQSYIKAGDFTIKGKLKSAVIDNAIYYGSYLLICGILLIYLALKPAIDLDWSKLKAIASTASNTWGLFLLVLLFGYALVEVPRSLWRNSNYSYVLSHSYFKAAKLSSAKCEAEETVDDVLGSLKAISSIIQPDHSLFVNLETILQKIPPELRDRMNSKQLPGDSLRDIPTEKALIRLHKQTIKSLQVLQRTETQWGILVEKIFDLEDTVRNQVSFDRRFKSTFRKTKSNISRILYTSTIEWYWKCLVYGYLTKFLSIIAGVFSVAVVWSEVTFFNKKPVLSIFTIIVNSARLNYDYFTIELLSTIIILYLSYCAYSTVLKIRLLNLYYLAPHHQTNEYSLIFSGMMLSRLTPPLCLNFLGLIQMDSHIIKTQILETHYTQIMGHMDVIGIISDGFNVYFPILILLFCLATYFSIGARLLSLIGFHQFVGEDEMTTDLVEEGKELMKREKRKRQRSEQTSNRRRDYEERFKSKSAANDSTRDLPLERPQNNTRINLLPESHPLDSYEGTNNTRDQFRHIGDEDGTLGSGEDEINIRFGTSTGVNRVGYPPRGIFDDV